MRSRAFLFHLAFALASTAALGADVLFDAVKRPMAGNADWVVDADAWDLVLPAYPCAGSTAESNPGRFPTPPESAIGPGTAETYWTGAVSSWAVDLVKAGHHVEVLPPTGRISFGDGTNPQDLSLYDLYVLLEPQSPFTPDEKTAILAFAAAGGGLFLVGDHETSDRDCDGSDSPMVLNDLTGAVSASSAGAFGIWFRVDGLANRGSADWFDDAVDANVLTDPADPVLHGPFGSGAGGLGLFGSTSMELNPSDNPSVKAHVWRTGASQGLAAVTFATASYGSGRVAAIGDSSPADDGTGDPADNLYPGWDRASGGVANREIHLNACHWLLNPAPDTTPPVIDSGPAADPKDCSAAIAWTTGEPSISLVEYGSTAGYGSQVVDPGLTRAHALTLTGLTPAAEHHYRAGSSDAAGNGPSWSGDAVFVTTVPAAPAILAGPSVTGISSAGAVVEWTTDEPSTSQVEYGETAAYGATAWGDPDVTTHRVQLGSLLPETTYHVRVGSADGCGNGPAHSNDLAFVTAPESFDLSGWTLRQMNSTQTYSIPPGTRILEGGYLVVGRNAGRPAFLAAHPSLPPETLYFDSNADGACSAAGCFPQINGGESFELRDGSGTLVDGATIAMTATHSSYQRNNPGDPAGSPASWAVVGEAAANPGQGVGIRSGAGVRIGEMSDAADYVHEFVELFYDAPPDGPDSTPPSAVTDLVATPVSSTAIRLEWTAVGDDGSTGIAQTYDVRVLARRILSEADFVSATPLAGEPPPGPAGTVQQYVAAGLTPDTAYYFALKVSDEVPNASGLSGSAGAVTALPGGGSSTTHLVVSRIRTGGTGDDVVELYNPTADPVPLASHSIQYLAANGNFGFRVNLPASDSVPAQGWYLAAADGFVPGGAPARDASLGTSNLSATAGHALLVSKTTNVSGCADAAIVDRVGYGAAAVCPEGGAGQSAQTPGAGQSVSRRPGGEAGAGQDTGVNSDDFLAPGPVSFHNRASAPADPPGGLGNVKDTLFLSKDPAGTRLNWARAAGASEYHVYRGTTPGFLSGLPEPWSTPSANSEVNPELPSGIFYYLVFASDGVSDSSN